MTTSDTLRHTRISTHGSGAIPAVGFGTLIPDPLVTKQATKAAFEAGFRHLGCAERYRNEEAVGEAIQESFKAGTLQREELFVTTKLRNSNHRPERVEPVFDGDCNSNISIAISSILRLPFNPVTSRTRETRTVG